MSNDRADHLTTFNLKEVTILKDCVGSQDGITVEKFAKGKTYNINEKLADMLIDLGNATDESAAAFGNRISEPSGLSNADESELYNSARASAPDATFGVNTEDANNANPNLTRAERRAKAEAEKKANQHG